MEAMITSTTAPNATAKRRSSTDGSARSGSGKNRCSGAPGRKMTSAPTARKST